jgi:tRNA-splicing ligase RtcB
MPDVHEGAEVPNGAVVATRRLIFPALVGADIGCGLAAVRFFAQADDFGRDELRTTLDLLGKSVPTLKQPVPQAKRLRSSIESLGSLSSHSLAAAANRDGRFQLGTLGRGNHFLELARDEAGDLWAVVHTGSRAMGQAITAHHLAAAKMPPEQLAHLDLQTETGQDYFADMNWACRYAAANRMIILNAVADVLEGSHAAAVDESSFLDCPHNFARLEEHAGETLCVHRKSANAAPADSLGLIAGSMAAGSRIVVGLGNPQSLCSSAHGAGRAMSRTEAAERISAREIKGTMRGVVYREQWANQLRDEGPRAYKDLHDVMRAQHDLVRTTRTLLPILNDKRP